MKLDQKVELKESTNKESTSPSGTNNDPWMVLTEAQVIEIKKQSIVIKATLEAQFGFVTENHPIHEKITNILNHLVKSASVQTTENFKPKLYIFNEYLDPEGFTLPNGDIFISVGLLKLCETEDQLAAVLAHELVHGSSAHAVNMIISIRDKNPLMQILDQRGFTRIAEVEADIIGASVILARSDYSPAAMTTLFEKFEGRTKADYYSASHGSFRDRIFQQKILSKTLDLSGIESPEKVHGDQYWQQLKQMELEARNSNYSTYLPKGGTNISKAAFETLLTRISNNPSTTEMVSATKILNRWYYQSFKMVNNEVYRDKNPNIYLGYNTKSDTTLESFKHSLKRAELLVSISTFLEDQDLQAKRYKALIFLMHYCEVNPFELYEQKGEKIPLFQKIDFNLTIENSGKIGFSRDNLLIVKILDDLSINGIEPLLQAYQDPIWQDERFKSLVSVESRYYLQDLYRELVSYEADFLLDDEENLDIHKIVETYNALQRSFSSLIEIEIASNSKSELYEISENYPELTKQLDALKDERWAVGRESQRIDQFFNLLHDVRDTDGRVELKFFDELLEVLKISESALAYFEARLVNQKEFDDFLHLLEILSGYNLGDYSKSIKNENLPFLLSIVSRNIGDRGRDSTFFSNVFTLLDIKDHIIFDQAVDELVKHNKSSLTSFSPSQLFTIYEHLEFLLNTSDSEKAFALLDKLSRGGVSYSTEKIITSGSFGGVSYDWVAEFSRNIYLGLNISERLIELADTPLKKLLAVELFFDKGRKTQTQSYISEQLGESTDRHELANFIKSNPTVGAASFLPLISRLFELSSTKQELSQATNITWQIIRDGAFNDATGLQAVEEAANREGRALDILCAGLLSYKTEQPLFGLFAERWFKIFQTPLNLEQELDLYTLLTTLSRPMSDEDFQQWKSFWGVEQRSVLEMMDDAHQKEQYTFLEELSLTDTINRVYELRPEAKKILVYKLLSSNKGILTNPQSRQKLFKFFVNEHLELEANEVHETLKVLETVFKNAKLVDILPYCLNVISERAFKLPPKQEDPITLIENADFLSEKIIRWSVPDLQSEGRKILGKLPKSHKELYRSTPYQILEDPIKEKLAHTLLPERYNERVIADTREIEQRIMSKIGATQFEDRIEDRKLDKYQVLKLLINQEGVLVRGTQILLQVWEFDNPNIYNELSDVFDNATGASKSSISKTVNDLIGDVIEEDDQLLDELGCGSKNTVYRFKRANGEEYALKVLNPNAETNAKVTLDIIEKTVSDLYRHDPKSSFLAIIENNVLPLLREWELGDINDQDFFEVDPQFRSWLKEEEAQRKGRFRIFAPEVLESIYYGEKEQEARKKIKLEQFVEGTNINNLIVREQSDFSKGIVSHNDYHEIIETLQDNYTRQLKNGIIHSNPHPGNFILTPEGELAIIDRNFYVRLSEKDKSVLKEIYLKSFLPLYNPISPFIRHIAPELTDDQVALKAKNIKDRVGKLSFSDPTQAKKLIFELTQEEIQVPLRFMLIAVAIGTFSKLHEKGKI